MKKIIIGILILIIGLSSSQLKAQNSVGAHQIHQHHRIKQGIRSGEITPVEAARLRAQQRKIHHEKRIAKADGIVTPAERAHIRGEQARASRKIYRQKHDMQNR